MGGPSRIIRIDDKKQDVDGTDQVRIHPSSIDVSFSRIENHLEVSRTERTSVE
jgi:hypothetical protein